MHFFRTMSNEQHVRLTKDWIMTMLFEQPRTFDDLMLHGCRVMVYGHSSYDVVDDITKSLIGENKIELRSDVLHLTGRGIFDVRKNTMLPLLKLTENPEYFKAFVAANRERCDIEFLELFRDQPSDEHKTSVLRQHTEQHFTAIANILHRISRFLAENPEFDDTGFNFPAS